MESLNLTDQELVRQFIDGSQSAFEVLLKRHKQKVYTHILYLVKEETLAEDLFQDTFIKVIKSLKQGRYNEDGRFSAWVMRIAHNLVIDYFRKQKNYKEISTDAFEIDIFSSPKFSEKNIEQNIVSKQLAIQLKNLVQELPEEQKSIVIMRLYLDMSFKEIADFTNVNINTALGRMRYAILNLRKLIQEKNLSLVIE
ncbi:MAG: sigma-70 family RNA polymerase sigma factor [Bacteroidales bacterium]|nr:sigma-70 family RNA polymerase sigma factor [Bacteroidales bacterium]